MRRSDNPEWGPWLDYFLPALLRQLRRLRAKVEREKLMMGSLPEVSARLLDLVRDHGRLTIGDAERLTGENRNTLKQHFRTLVGNGHLALNGTGQGRGTRSDKQDYVIVFYAKGGKPPDADAAEHLQNPCNLDTRSPCGIFGIVSTWRAENRRSLRFVQMACLDTTG